jgi:hypothetical protein
MGTQFPPIPTPDAESIHVHGASGTLPAMSRVALKARVGSGEIKLEDSFWYEGMAGWSPLAEHPGLLQGVGGAAAPAPGAAPAGTEDDRLDAVFGGLVKESWSYFNAHAYASHVDEVFLGAIITSVLDTGYALIDLSSDGTHHYTRFENLGDHSRIICRLTHLTGDLTRAKVQGHRASVILGYGEKSNDFARILQALKAEMKSGYLQSAEPGTITVDGDLNTGYVYVQIDLYLCVDDYVSPDYAIRYDVLQEHLGATVHALRKYLKGRFAR